MTEYNNKEEALAIVSSAYDTCADIFVHIHNEEEMDGLSFREDVPMPKGLALTKLAFTAAVTAPIAYVLNLEYEEVEISKEVEKMLLLRFFPLFLASIMEEEGKAEIDLRARDQYGAPQSFFTSPKEYLNIKNTLDQMIKEYYSKK